MRLWNGLALAAVAVATVAGIDWWLERYYSTATPAHLDPRTLRPGLGDRSHEAALANEDLSLQRWQARLDRDPADWVSMEGVALSHAAGFRLRGDFAELAKADSLLEEAMAKAPWPAGPVISRAEISLTVHRLDSAEAALKRLDAWVVPPSAGERAIARSLRCEIALQRGLPRAAREICAQGKDLGQRMRLANIAAKMGRFSEAERLLEELLRVPRQSPHNLAVLSLQRASVALARGDFKTAGMWSRAADRMFPGYWLSEAFVAQQFALEGNLAEASRRYSELATRTGNPDIIDAHVMVLKARGREAEAGEWIARSRRAWDERMRLLPEAASTHFAEHLFKFGEGRAALDLAALEYRRRPTATSAVNYAAILAALGEPARGLDVLKETERRGWNTAKLKYEAASALRALGRKREAHDALQSALALNPLITDPSQSFISFDQD